MYIYRTPGDFFSGYIPGVEIFNMEQAQFLMITDVNHDNNFSTKVYPTASQSSHNVLKAILLIYSG